ncbi:hypothetical protein [Arthrobacter sp. UYEF36]|uniref:hypothetical protein n=1 Tax=Arthrobacter sp. UYEF36 TaxID=1756366 RepID=UPI00339B01B1
MASDFPKDSGPARQGDDLVMTVASERSAGVPAGTGEDLGWRRISLWRSFTYLMIPVAILSLMSGSLALATQWSPPETVETARFWFYFFDVGREINLPTWFSAGLWITAGILAGYFARRASRHRRSWALFCVVCVVFSIDETLELHERLDAIGNELGRYLPLQLGFTWVIPGVLIAGLIVLSLLRMVLALPRTPRAGLLAAGIIFVGGGVGVETLSGLFVQGDTLPWQFFLLTLVEETLEMTGIALGVAALAHLIAYRHSADRSTAFMVADRPLPEIEPAAGP